MKKTESNNRPKSKNNPNGKRGDPPIDWCKYHKRRKAEGQKHLDWMRRVADKVRELLGLDKGRRDLRVSAVLVYAAKSDERFSCWDLVKHFREHPDDLGLYGPDRGRTADRGTTCAYPGWIRAYCNSSSRGWAKRMPARHSW